MSTVAPLYSFMRSRDDVKTNTLISSGMNKKLISSNGGDETLDLYFQRELWSWWKKDDDWLLDTWVGSYNKILSLVLCRIQNYSLYSLSLIN